MSKYISISPISCNRMKKTNYHFHSFLLDPLYVQLTSLRDDSDPAPCLVRATDIICEHLKNHPIESGCSCKHFFHEYRRWLCISTIPNRSVIECVSTLMLTVAQKVSGDQVLEFFHILYDLVALPKMVFERFVSSKDVDLVRRALSYKPICDDDLLIIVLETQCYEIQEMILERCCLFFRTSFVEELYHYINTKQQSNGGEYCIYSFLGDSHDISHCLQYLLRLLQKLEMK